MTFDGPVEVEVTGAIADDLLASLREALSNVARHAGASTTIVEITASPDAVQLRVTDDGSGIPREAADAGGRGLVNMASRASRHGGRCSVTRAATGGTVVEWVVPADRDAG